jgi:glycogen debranching enzyme
MKTFGQSATARNKARSFLAGLEAHLREASLGQVSEIFDAEAPQAMRRWASETHAQEDTQLSSAARARLKEAFRARRD